MTTPPPSCPPPPHYIAVLVVVSVHSEVTATVRQAGVPGRAVTRRSQLRLQEFLASPREGDTVAADGWRVPDGTPVIRFDQTDYDLAWQFQVTGPRNLPDVPAGRVEVPFGPLLPYAGESWDELRGRVTGVAPDVYVALAEQAGITVERVGGPIRDRAPIARQPIHLLIAGSHIDRAGCGLGPADILQHGHLGLLVSEAESWMLTPEATQRHLREHPACRHSNVCRQCQEGLTGRRPS